MKSKSLMKVISSSKYLEESVEKHVNVELETLLAKSPQNPASSINQIENCDCPDLVVENLNNSASPPEGQAFSHGLGNEGFHPNAPSEFHGIISQLQSKCENLETELHEQKAQKNALEEIRGLLNQKDPEMNKVLEISLKQEKIKHDQRYMKIYQILKTKDVAIESLKARIAQFSQSASSFQNEVQQFEAYKQQVVDDIERKKSLFRINSNGVDAESLQDFHEEISRLNGELNSRAEEIEKFHLVVQTLEERNESATNSLEEALKKCQEFEEQISAQNLKISDLEAENQSQKDQVNNLVANLASLSNDNMQNIEERSKTIKQEENLIEKVNQLQETINTLKEENASISTECNSIKEIHMSFLLNCNEVISPGATVGKDSDIEFVQNTILENIKDMQESIQSYQSRHQDDQGCLKMMEKEILKIQNNIANKKYSTKGEQTQISGDDLAGLTQKIQTLEQEYSRAVEENDRMRDYVQDLEAMKTSQGPLSKSKKYVKSTTSLAYSVDDENEESGPSHLKTAKTQRNQDRLSVNNKENVDLNSSLNSISIETESEGRPRGEVQIKRSQIKLKSGNRDLFDPNILKDKSVEQQILIADQRRQIEELRKSNMSYESKLNYDIKEKNQIIQSLEGKIESLQSVNSKLKHSERSKLGEGEDDLEHYISQLELNEIELKNNLQQALQQKESCENYNQELLLSIKDLEEANLNLRNRLDLDDLDIDQESTANILSLKVSTQKKEIRLLKGNLEKIQDKYDNLLYQVNNREGCQLGGDLVQSQISYGLGASKGPDNMVKIESLVHNNPVLMQNEALLGSSLLSSIQSTDSKITGKKLKRSDLKASDLDSSARPKIRIQEDAPEAPNTAQEGSSAIKILQNQLVQSQRLVQHLSLEIENLVGQNKELHSKLSDERQSYVDKLNFVHSAFSEEKETLVQEKKEYEEKFNIAKLDIKLGYKEQKLQELQGRITELREESGQEINEYKAKVKQLEKDLKEMSHKFDTQQDELDKCNCEVTEKQSNIEFLAETIQTLQNPNSDSLQEKFLTQNSELCQYKGINKKLEAEVQK